MPSSLVYISSLSLYWSEVESQANSESVYGLKVYTKDHILLFCFHTLELNDLPSHLVLFNPSPWLDAKGTFSKSLEIETIRIILEVELVRS